MSEKSSFLQRRISKEDAIIQIFRPMFANRVSQALDVFDRIVTEAETLTRLGTKLQPGNGAEHFFVTPQDLKDNLDEFGELEQLAKQGRELLVGLKYKSPRKSVPIMPEGTAPVGKTVDVQPITMTLPGSEPLSGVVVLPKPASVIEAETSKRITATKPESKK